MTVGLVVKVINNYYYVDIGEHIVETTLRGRIKRTGVAYVGDKVEVTRIENGTTGVIENILPRKNLFKRPPVANVDNAVLVFACRQPDYHPVLVDRFLVLAEEAGVHVQLCFNKVDLIDEIEKERLFNYYAKIGYSPLLISAKYGEGMRDLCKILEGRLSILAGPSGVGKSSILNYLHPGANLKVGDLSEKIKRGKQTTRHIQLIKTGKNGWVADTPGFSFLYFTDMQKEELAYFFPEMIPYIQQCKLPSCIHFREPLCGVKSALEQGKIEQQRYDSYLTFLQEIMEEERKKYD